MESKIPIDNIDSIYSIEEIENAVREGHIELIKSLSEKGLLNEDSRASALFKAAYHGHLNIIKYLCQGEGTLWVLSDSDFENALYSASQEGRLEVVKYLCDQIRKPKVPQLRFAFLRAAQFDGPKILKFYLELIEKSNEYASLNIKELAAEGLISAAKVANLNSMKFLSDNVSFTEEVFVNVLKEVIKSDNPWIDFTGVVKFLIPKISKDARLKLGNETEKEEIKKLLLDEKLAEQLCSAEKSSKEKLKSKYLPLWPDDDISDSENQSYFSSPPLSLEELSIASTTNRSSYKSFPPTDPELDRRMDLFLEKFSSNSKNPDIEYSNTDSSQESEDANADLNQEWWSQDWGDSNTDSSQESETEGFGINMHLSMQILGLFIGALGIASVALAFTVLAASSGGIAAVVVGTVALVIGLGLFAKGTYDQCMANSEDNLTPDF